MTDSKWVFRRLRAMSIPEIGWRIAQKIRQEKEKKRFLKNKIPVTAGIFFTGSGRAGGKGKEGRKLAWERLYVSDEVSTFSAGTDILLLGGYLYKDYKKRWAAGFQTDKDWPDQFSYGLQYRQREDIGDARTNWELNRHFQFAILAKNYRATGDKKYLDELQDLFFDWNEKNPFLWGIAWTSVMEVAIRTSNWCYTYCFLKQAKEVPEKLMTGLCNGIWNMTAYIMAHRSRYSSANNHLIVEAYAIGQSGILFRYPPWIHRAVSILDREMLRQNYPDGVHKELSLHYQSFSMEAMGLMIRLMIKDHIPVPDGWEDKLKRMCRYMTACIGEHGETVAFGDNDEGKNLDLHGEVDHHRYVLALFSVLLEERYLDLQAFSCENLDWLFTKKEQERAKRKPLYQAPCSACFRMGGYTILRSRDRRILIGIDHGPLGFGRIAAHGHADALSFQLFADGQAVFADPGTYIYHCDRESRDAYRKTEAHNTVSIDGKDQSEMLGAFLWGKRARCKLVEFKEMDGQVTLTAQHDGYRPIVHTRQFVYTGGASLQITDRFPGAGKKDVHFIFGPEVAVKIAGASVRFETDRVRGDMQFTCGDMQLRLEERMYAKVYGVQERTRAVCLKTCGEMVVTDIEMTFTV